LILVNNPDFLQGYSSIMGNQRRDLMFIDEVVLAGIGTVGLMVAFLGGVGLFIWRDSHKKKRQQKAQ
tara:strand:- start:26 stop:226 length:201 start_codon:yes stop_codon:yes gene_type:complete